VSLLHSEAEGNKLVIEECPEVLEEEPIPIPRRRKEERRTTDPDSDKERKKKPG